jgi:hypothetical protein
MTLMGRGAKPTCDRCGGELGCVDVTAWGDSEHKFVAVEECPCPRPVCPFCAADLTAGKCFNVDCFLCGHLVPCPEVV